MLFDNIDESTIAKVAFRTKGSDGPSGLDSDGWKHILVSGNYGLIWKDFRDALALCARKLCTEKIDSNNNGNDLEAYTPSRLIPLNKNSDVRPIGVGEVIGKAFISTIKPEFSKAQVLCNYVQNKKPHVRLQCMPWVKSFVKKKWMPCYFC